MRATSRRRTSEPSCAVFRMILPNSSSVCRRPRALMEIRKSLSCGSGSAPSCPADTGRFAPASPSPHPRPSDRGQRPYWDPARRASHIHRSQKSDLADAGQARQLILHFQRGVVAHIQRVVLPAGENRCTTRVSVGDRFWVVIPRRRTSSGRRASACATRFCT